MKCYPTLRRVSTRIALILLAVALLAQPLPAAMAAKRALPYVEAGLGEASDLRIGAIVTADDSSVAAQAVAGVGGVVTSDLWIIDAVAASLTGDQLDRLSQMPGLDSITANKGVQIAGDPGWVTQRRIPKGQYVLEGTQDAPGSYLPDGGFVSIAENGKVLIANADGSERARVSLDGGPFKTACAVVVDGTIIVAGEAKRIHALYADGSSSWSFAAQEKFLASISYWPSGGFIVAADERRNVYALDTDDGSLLWQATASGDGAVKAAPVVGQDGTIYVVTEKGSLSAIDAHGQLAWTYTARDGDPFLQSPMIGEDGTVYLAGEDKWLHAVEASGSTRYQFVTDSKVLAQPALSADGNLYVATEEGRLYSLDASGSQRFVFEPPEVKFKTSPVLSMDGLTVYVAAEQATLFAVDTSNGQQRWQYSSVAAIKASPTVLDDETISLGDEDGNLVLLDTNGHVVVRTTVPGKITQSAKASARGDVAVAFGDDGLMTLGRLPKQWDGGKDVVATSSKKIWQLVNPVAVDLGADVVHASTLPDGHQVTGQGVVVAVLDSGVYFDEQVKLELGQQVKKLFVGQADFVGDGACQQTVASPKDGSIVQENSYCFYNSDTSVDPSGHGSHVAGIVWNQHKDDATDVTMGIAPGANILSVRVLGENGGTYEDVIEGIQYVVENKDVHNIRVMNLSLSAEATTPYFVDPLNRAVERAWASGIVVVAAAGNTGPNSQSITVPGNDPYVITVGAIDEQRTPGYWTGDVLPTWSATGPTRDGFIKPDVLAPGSQIVSFMYNDHENPENSSELVQNHPDYAENEILFRMNGTSMAAAITSGVVALMLQAHPELTPDQVKYRLMYTARPAMVGEDILIYNPLQQGVGRIWALDAVLGEDVPDGRANQGMDILADLDHGIGWVDANGDGWVQMDELDEAEMAYHYQGPVVKLLSDDGSAYLYITPGQDDEILALGAAWAADHQWIDTQTLLVSGLTWADGQLAIDQGMVWSGGVSAQAGTDWDALNWGALNWGALNWGALNWGALNWGALNWGALNWGALNWGALNWGALNWGALNWGALNWGALNLGALNWGALNWGALNWGALNWGTLNWGSLGWSSVSQLDACGISATNWVNDDGTVQEPQLPAPSTVEPEPTIAPEPVVELEPVVAPEMPEEPTEPSVHVGDLDASFTMVNSNKWMAYVSVLVLDEDGDPVPGATVRGTWHSSLVEDTATTNDAGRVDFSSKLMSLTDSYSQFTVQGVSAGSVPYQPELNADPDGDSDGKSIEIMYKAPR